LRPYLSVSLPNIQLFLFLPPEQDLIGQTEWLAVTQMLERRLLTAFAVIKKQRFDTLH
jgi:hypothetical protein